MDEVSLNELFDAVVCSSFKKYFTPCIYYWLFEISEIKKMKVPEFRDLETNDVLEMESLHLNLGHHFDERASFPVLYLLKASRGVPYSMMEMGSTSTPADIYAKTNEGNICIEIGGVTSIGKLMTDICRDLFEVWLYNYGEYVYVFKTRKRLSLYEFLKERQPDAFFESLKDNRTSGCVFKDSHCDFYKCYTNMAPAMWRLLEELREAKI
jgi:hypothetical protein